MSISSLIWGSSQFDESVDKATSDLLPSGSEDIALNLEICDLIRSKNVTPSAAMKKLKTRLNHSNPNVQLLVLSLTDTCIKNGGDAFLAEITSREFIDNLISILKQPALNGDVKNRVLYYIQNWALSLEGRSAMGYLGSKYRQLQNEGFDFPPRDVSGSSAAMVETQVAPEWIDSDVCLRCRTPFSFTNRKHHCRNCGQVFDQQCSSKTRVLPHFGITTEVRVCDSCFTLLNKGQLAKSLSANSHSASSSRPRVSRPRSVPDYDKDLQEAIKRSLAENRQGSSSWASSEPPLVERAARAHASEEDPELRAAIEASLREAQSPRPSAPTFSDEPTPQQYHQPYASNSTAQQPEVPRRSNFTLPNYDLDTGEADAVLSFNQAVEYAQTNGSFSSRQSHDVSQLFDQASRVRPKIALSLDDTHRKHQLLMDMNHKISEVTRLYDHLLDQQLSQHRWRSEAPVPLTSPPLRNDSRSHTETWRQPSIPEQSYTYQQAMESFNQGSLSPPQQVMSPAQIAPSQSISQPWAGPSQHRQPSYNAPVVLAPLSQVSPQPPLASIQQLQSPTQASVPPQPVHRQTVLSQPPTAPTAVASPPAVTVDQYPAHHPPAASPPVILPAAPSAPTFAPQPNNPIPQQTAIPLFPTVPQAEPQIFEPYNSRLSGVEQPERKEALLIDL